MKNQNIHVDIYEGPYDYLFVSYAHADADRVMPVIKRLSDDGVRIWYDDGIEIGSSWDDNIAHHISRAKGVILFFSNNYFNSNNCKDEANYARDLGKDQIIIQLEDTKIPPGMEMRFNRIQSVSVTDDLELMFKKIYASSVLKNCRRIGVEEAETATIKKAAVSAETQKTKWIAIIAVACVVLAGIILAIILVTRKPSAPQEGNVVVQPDTETVQDTEPASKEETTTKEEAASKEDTEESDGKTANNAASVEYTSYTFGTQIDIYEANTDNIQYTIKVDDIHVMPEEFESNTWEKYDKDVFDLLSVKCSIENYGFNSSETGKLSLYSLLHDSTVLVKDPDDYLLRFIEAMYHGSDGSYEVQTAASIPAGSKGRFALLFYVEKGTPSVTISLDNHHGVIAKSEPIDLEW